MMGLTIFNQEDGLGELKGAANLARVAKAEQAAKAANEAKNMSKASNDIIKRLENNGYNVHQLKRDVGGDSKHDIFQNGNGDLFVNLKNGSGEPQPLGVNIRDLR
ncbi:MAG TPA: polymorphic toxin type 33 domain-containing protein [Bacillota bacterium]|nr:polymorphic toxin type 33 domain-containing protein [Bacillota bacterium]